MDALETLEAVRAGRLSIQELPEAFEGRELLVAFAEAEATGAHPGELGSFKKKGGLLPAMIDIINTFSKKSDRVELYRSMQDLIAVQRRLHEGRTGVVKALAGPEVTASLAEVLAFIQRARDAGAVVERRDDRTGETYAVITGDHGRQFRAMVGGGFINEAESGRLYFAEWMEDDPGSVFHERVERAFGAVTTGSTPYAGHLAGVAAEHQDFQPASTGGLMPDAVNPATFQPVNEGPARMPASERPLSVADRVPARTVTVTINGEVRETEAAVPVDAVTVGLAGIKEALSSLDLATQGIEGFALAIEAKAIGGRSIDVSALNDLMQQVGANSIVVVVAEGEPMPVALSGVPGAVRMTPAELLQALANGDFFCLCFQLTPQGFAFLTERELHDMIFDLSHDGLDLVAALREALLNGQSGFDARFSGDQGKALLDRLVLLARQI